jgi:hypothetical protein
VFVAASARFRATCRAPRPPRPCCCPFACAPQRVCGQLLPTHFCTSPSSYSQPLYRGLLSPCTGASSRALSTTHKYLIPYSQPLYRGLLSPCTGASSRALSTTHKYLIELEYITAGRRSIGEPQRIVIVLSCLYLLVIWYRILHPTGLSSCIERMRTQRIDLCVHSLATVVIPCSVIPRVVNLAPAGLESRFYGTGPCTCVFLLSCPSFLTVVIIPNGINIYLSLCPRALY